MKAGASALKILGGDGRRIARGGHRQPRRRALSDERVPTLAEALEPWRPDRASTSSRVYYGHNQRLEERVVEVVEAAGMEKDIVTMSLNGGMVAKMKRLRPEWTSGLLSAKAIGDLSGAPADFLAVEKAMATRRFIWAAHRVGKPVYAWTVDDPARMIRLIGLGVDGIITNHPDVAREVVDRYRGMTQAERLFLFVMTRLGVEADVTPPDDDLRP
jgi:glycerophosphoryl diester phosphodiesterase